MSSIKKNIVIVTSEFPPQPGGIGNHAYNLALYLAKENYQVKVIADQRSNDGADEIVFDKSLPFKVIRIKRHNLRFKMYFKRVLVTYQSFKNANHVIATGKFSLWNVAFSRLFRKRQIIAITHGTEVNFKSFFVRKFVDISLKKFDTIIAVSNYTEQLMSHLNREVEVIPNGIDLSHWQMGNLPEINVEGGIVLTTVGRVSSRKGQLNVIKQLPELVKYFPELHYHCIGIPTEADAFTKVAKELNVDSYITFHGSLDSDVMKQILNKTDVFVMLSSESITGDVEGFGIAILEANAMGVPAIGSKGCGIEDAIKTGYSGVLIDADDTMQFKNGIENIIKEKARYKQDSIHWANQHDWTKVIQRYIDLLQ